MQLSCEQSMHHFNSIAHWWFLYQNASYNSISILIVIWHYGILNSDWSRHSEFWYFLIHYKTLLDIIGVHFKRKYYFGNSTSKFHILCVTYHFFVNICGIYYQCLSGICLKVNPTPIGRSPVQLKVAVGYFHVSWLMEACFRHEIKIYKR